MQERSHLEDMSVDGRVILKGFLKLGAEKVDWLYFVHERASGELS
jgi:hypothetical protein